MANDRTFSYRQGELLADAFARHGVDYLFIGKSGALFLGFPDTTQDVDLFPRKDADNGARVVAALKELGFSLDERKEGEIVAGKDFVEIKSGPFDVDLVFAPDGIESFEDAKKRRVLVGDRFPVAHIDDIIRSKRAANRRKDRESLPRLEEFAKFLRLKG